MSTEAEQLKKQIIKVLPNPQVKGFATVIRKADKEKLIKSN